MKRVAFVGSKKLGVSVLEDLYRVAPSNLCAVITVDDSRDVRCAFKSFQQFSKKTGKPIRVLGDGSELDAAISEFSPDMCVVVGWYWILRRNLLDMVPEGWLGIHGSLLPKYRGGSPLVWAIINGETESGLSLFYFNEGMDTGDIITQKSFEIARDETIADILYKVQELSTKVIRDTYRSLLDGTAPRIPQDHSRATYVSPREQSDGRIDWNQSAVQIYNFIRAQTKPYPGAFAFMPSGKMLRIWKAEVFPFPYYGVAGRVVTVKDDDVVVACGGGTALSLLTVQIDGQSEEPASKVLKYRMKLA
jgi:methionyl-tRNA formyltransferase